MSTPPDPVSPETLAAELLTFCQRLMTGNAQAVWVLLEELGLSLTHIKTLHALQDYAGADELSVKELSATLGMSLPNASRTVDALLKKGYLERREDERDRRIKRVALTPEGHAAVARIDTARLRGLEAFAAAIPADRRVALHAALQDLLPEDSP